MWGLGGLVPIPSRKLFLRQAPLSTLSTQWGQSCLPLCPSLTLARPSFSCFAAGLIPAACLLGVPGAGTTCCSNSALWRGGISTSSWNRSTIHTEKLCVASNPLINVNHLGASRSRWHPRAPQPSVLACVSGGVGAKGSPLKVFLSLCLNSPACG